MKVGDLVLVQRASLGIPDGVLALIVGEAISWRQDRYFKVVFLTDKVSKLVRDLPPGSRGYLPEHLEVVSGNR